MKKSKWIKSAALGILLYQSALPLTQVVYAEDLAPPVEMNEAGLKSDGDAILAGEKLASAQSELPEKSQAELEKPVKNVQSQNEAAIWSFDTESGTLTISGGSIGADSGAYAAPWLGVPGGPADKNTVEKIKFTGAVTGNASLNKLFSDYQKVQVIEFNNYFDTSTVKSMGDMFSNCSSLTSVDVNNFDTSAVTHMGWMFKDCNSLMSVDVSNFNTSAVTDMFAMFHGCNSLTSIDVSNFNTSKVVNMQRMFLGCNKLVQLDLSSFNTIAVNSGYGMGNIFNDCSTLSKLIVGPDFTFGSSTYLRNATWYQNQTITPTLTTAEIPAAHNSQGQTNTFTTGWVAQFDTQGGSLVDPIIVLSGASEKERTVTKPTTDPTKSGHTFEGWYQDVAGENEFDFTQPINEDTTIYAKWRENIYQVTFKADSNGTLSGKNSVDVAEGKTLTASQVPTPVANKGYEFSEWVDSDKNPVKDLTKVAITKDQTFTAVFKKQQVAVKKAKLYRIYNPNSGEHFYTQNEYERKNLTNLGWHDEGVASEQPTNVGENVYRLYNPNVGEHHYTPHKSEVEFLKKAGWDYEGTAFKSDGNKKMHRLYNPNAVTGTHHYTLLESEKNWLEGLGWSHEGTGWKSY